MQQEPPIVIVGAGYVGLTLGLFIASRGTPVLLVDTDLAKLERLQRGDPTLYEAELQKLLSESLESGMLRFASKPPEGGAVYWIIAVPYHLPEPSLRGARDPYLACLKSIRSGSATPPVVMIRSTLPVGFTQSQIAPFLSRNLGAPLDKGFYLSVCPERTLTGMAIRELGSIPQLVGGSPASVAETVAFFERCGISCIQLENLEAAELGKAFCNLSRLAQFNLSNFLGLCCERLGLNTPNLIRALRAQYPRLQQMPAPGPGVGGSCLPKDSILLLEGLLQSLGVDPNGDASSEGVWSYPKQQHRMNEEVISSVVESVAKFTAETSGPVLALGIAFKGLPRTDDTRNSVGLRVVEHLLREGRQVHVHDLTVPASAVKALGLHAAPLPLRPDRYGTLLLLNNDPGYRTLLREALAPETQGDVALYDPWRLVLEESPTVFSKTLAWAWLCERLGLQGASEKQPASLKR